MRKAIFLITFNIICANSFSQVWGNWIAVGYGIEISFKFGKTPCSFANTYARLRNTSSNKYCFVNVGFTTFCDNKTDELNILVNNFLPGAIDESRGNFYSTSLRVNNITLTKLEDANCKTIVNKSITVLQGNNNQSGTGNNGNISTIPYKNGGYGIPQDGDVINNPKPQAYSNTNSTNIPPQLTPKNGKTTYGISQEGDVITNPKPQINYSQKQKEEDKATAERMKAWQNSYQQNQDQLNAINNPKNNQQSQSLQQKQQQLQAQQQLIKQQQAQEKLNQVQQQLAEQQQRYQQTQIEFSIAETAADNAYQSAIESGKKESGAMLDATLAATEQLSDPTSQLTTLGVGLATSLFMHFAEKKQERLEKEAAIKREEERKQAIINAKSKYVFDAMNINKYGFADLISKQRYAALLITPLYNSPEEQNIYFTIPVLVPKYVDSTYALKDELEKKLLTSITLDKSQLAGMKVNTLYPITDVEKFQDEFTKKMGSGHLLFLKAHLLNFIKAPFNESENKESTDFWGNSIKKEKTSPIKKETTTPTKKSENNFWNR
jgi:hypothetical protein